ncbi:MAG: M23 family metallopeptidase [Candidatus Aminicenantales bacterium]
MKRVFPQVLFLLMLIPSSGADNAVVRFACGIEVELIAPSLEPGRILLARLVQASGAKRVVIGFGDAVYELRMGQEGSEAFALIGLDLGLKPGSHDLKITVFLRDGRVEELRHRLLVGDREFPVKKLRVKQEFVTPPPEVEERIRWESELLQMVYSVITETWLGEGAFEWPHPGENAGNFGERRIYNGVPRSSHSGLDIAAPFGSPVRASNSGRVVLARDLYFSGKTVILDHGLGVFSIYCHFSRLKVSRGQDVKKGDILALAGSTGRSTGPHLHWAVRILGSRVDPQALLELSLPE